MQHSLNTILQAYDQMADALDTLDLMFAALDKYRKEKNPQTKQRLLFNVHTIENKLRQQTAQVKQNPINSPQKKAA